MEGARGTPPIPNVSDKGAAGQRGRARAIPHPHPVSIEDEDSRLGFHRSGTIIANNPKIF